MFGDGPWVYCVYILFVHEGGSLVEDFVIELGPDGSYTSLRIVLQELFGSPNLRVFSNQLKMYHNKAWWNCLNYPTFVVNCLVFFVCIKTHMCVLGAIESRFRMPHVRPSHKNRFKYHIVSYIHSWQKIMKFDKIILQDPPAIIVYILYIKTINKF